MSFEKEVLAKVAKILKDENSASFFCGSLSVICDERQARSVWHMLFKDYNGKVQISRDGSYGYIYDFTA